MSTPSFKSPLRVEYLNGETWRLLEPFSYECTLGDLIIVPAGFETDFASIPRVLWTIYPPAGRWGKAAVIHDYLYYHGMRSRKSCDRVFLQGMKDLGVPRCRRTLMYLAVRLGGRVAWAKHRLNQRERLETLRLRAAKRYGKRDR